LKPFKTWSLEELAFETYYLKGFKRNKLLKVLKIGIKRKRIKIFMKKSESY